MIKSFSFRYGEQTGKKEWFRVEDDEKAICVRIDTWDGEDHAYFAEEDAAFLERLAETLEILSPWNGFYDIGATKCSGDSWVLHVFYQDGREVHAMGHSSYPEGFAEGKAAIEAFFAPYEK